MRCIYCNESASQQLDGADVCYDCYARLGNVPASKRHERLHANLQGLHAMLLRLSIGSDYARGRLTELGRRIEFVGKGLRTHPVENPRSGPLKVSRFK